MLNKKKGNVQFFIYFIFLALSSDVSEITNICTKKQTRHESFVTNKRHVNAICLFCFNEIFINLNLRFKRDLNVIKLFFAEETKDVFLPLRFYQFQRSVSLSPQNAKGRHFITAYDNKSSTYQVSHQCCIKLDINHVSGQISIIYQVSNH